MCNNNCFLIVINVFYWCFRNFWDGHGVDLMVISFMINLSLFAYDVISLFFENDHLIISCEQVFLMKMKMRNLMMKRMKLIFLDQLLLFGKILYSLEAVFYLSRIMIKYQMIMINLKMHPIIVILFITLISSVPGFFR
jgi:hypothetical protein